ncbi:MAG: ATP synthase F0 subunit B [Deltaproteobacteria bacterium]|nr:ATP synthase F0 subunit B [Deltaproteobacteria bacterium]MCL5791929.1 ATP synthase F0 subunit B [Deltaproteobacteria bacterium]
MHITLKDVILSGIQGIIFLIVWISLYLLFFKPFSIVYKKRSSKTVEAIEEAKELNKKSEELEFMFREKLDEALKEAAKIKNEQLTFANNQMDEIIKQTHQTVQGKLEKVISSIDIEKNDIIKKIGADLKTLIPAISNRILLK